MIIIRKTILPLFILLLLGLALKASVWADKVTPYDFIPPSSYILNLQTDLQASIAKRGDNPSTINTVINLNFLNRYNSIPYAWYFIGDGRLSINKLYNEISGKSNFEYQFNIDGNLGFQKYFSDSDFFFYFDLDINYNYPEYLQPRIDNNLGFGYGRYYNVTPIFVARQIERFLLKTGDLISSLVREDIIALSQIISNMDVYEENFSETYQGEMMRDILDVIENSGKVIGGEVSAMGILRIRQVLFPDDLPTEISALRIIEREFGWQVRLGPSLLLTDEKERTVTEQTPNLKMLVDFSLPIYWRFLWKEVLEIQTEMSSDMFSIYFASLASEVVFEIYSFLDISLSTTVTFKRLTLDDPHIWGLTLSTDMVFYIENMISTTITFSFEKIEDEESLSEINWDKRLYLSINYDIF